MSILFNFHANTGFYNLYNNISKTSSKKYNLGVSKSTKRSTKSLKNEESFNIRLFIFEIEIPNFSFSIFQKSSFYCSQHKQISSRWINSQFLCWQDINLKATNDNNFSWATFLIFNAPPPSPHINSQKGLAKPPPENNWANRTSVQSFTWHHLTSETKYMIVCLGQNHFRYWYPLDNWR